ncbi:hypothetical protein EG68_07683 [Paragonimus skrjabini miyazakii]|uniref:Uncharacterized protein n=1 Tax=Paragonimus skrjabini miyazakii TaxID=59628 RepID=A0A8S9YWC1_9TREM|nr:hypothetical protein EG68_07683 [Paragonimus skrjabini miyazakii]
MPTGCYKNVMPIVTRLRTAHTVHPTPHLADDRFKLPATTVDHSLDLSSRNITVYTTNQSECSLESARSDS